MGSRTTSQPSTQKPSRPGSLLKCHTPGIYVRTNALCSLCLGPLLSLCSLPRCLSHVSPQPSPAPPSPHYPLCFSWTRLGNLSSLSESSKSPSCLPDWVPPEGRVRAPTLTPPCPPARPLTQHVQQIAVADAAQRVLHKAGVCATVRGHHAFHHQAPVLVAQLGAGEVSMRGHRTMPIQGTRA